MLKNIFTSFHKKTKRNYLERMVNKKVHCMNIARKFSFDYWDGLRKYGFGGYKYIPGLLTLIAKRLIKNYKLKNNSSILEVGCGKGYLLYEIKKILPGINISGFDISRYALKNSKIEVKQDLFYHSAQKKYPFRSKKFDLVISLNTLHNLKIFDLLKAVKEIERVGKKKFIVVESYKNVKHLFNLQCWALTAESFFSNKEWIWLFKKFGYKGDYEFIYFE
jgi:ubiquinone/menaquinone biosynthesis C-methylase UbiE